MAVLDLQRKEVMIEYTAMICPSMKCPLCGNTFTSSESTTIDRSYSLLFCPRWTSTLWLSLSLGCFGFTDIYTDQGIYQIQSPLISHVCHNDGKGRLIQILLEDLQLVIGVSRPPSLNMIWSRYPSQIYGQVLAHQYLWIGTLHKE